MKILKDNSKNLKVAAAIILRGGLVVYPTDTLYGLGCNPYNEEAVQKLYKVKCRENKPIPLLVSSLAKAKQLAYFTPPAKKAAEEFWPGPLTLVLKRKQAAPCLPGGDPQLIGLRIPDHSPALELIRLSGGCLTGTSANLSGKMSPSTAAEAAAQIGDYVDLILDGGKTRLGVESTILDLSGERPRILRKGALDMYEFIQQIML